MFVEPSPVPKFRNVAPPPPPSPLYMNIIVDQAELDDHDSISRKSDFLSVIKSPTMENDAPTIFAPKEMISENNLSYFDVEDEDEDRRMTLLMESLRPRPIRNPIFTLTHLINEDKQSHLPFKIPFQKNILLYLNF